MNWGIYFIILLSFIYKYKLMYKIIKGFKIVIIKN